MGKAQTAARDLLLSILDPVTHILENHVLVGKLMEAKANVGDNGGASGTQGIGNPAWLNNVDINGATGGYIIGFALTVIQIECQKLICDILRATPDAAFADAAVQTAIIEPALWKVEFRDFGLDFRDELDLLQKLRHPNVNAVSWCNNSKHFDDDSH